jgi:plasmid stabilization system protein ParE
MQLKFLPAAQKEMLDSVRYYDSKNSELGSKFIDEVMAVTDQIQKYPESGSLINDYARRVLLERFEFGVIYRIYDNEIVILAVMHVKRKPNYWIRRNLQGK